MDCIAEESCPVGAELRYVEGPLNVVAPIELRNSGCFWRKSSVAVNAARSSTAFASRNIKRGEEESGCLLHPFTLTLRPARRSNSDSSMKSKVRPAHPKRFLTRSDCPDAGSDWEFGLADVQFLHPGAQSAGVEVQNRRRTRFTLDYPTGAFEHLENVGALHCFERGQRLR